MSLLCSLEGEVCEESGSGQACGVAGGAHLSPPEPPTPPHSEQYKAHFWPRDLRAFSARPLLAAPTHYAGDAEWLSDTETSSPWDDDSGRIVSWSGSHKTLRDPRLDLAGSSGHSLPTPPHPRDEL